MKKVNLFIPTILLSIGLIGCNNSNIILKDYDTSRDTKFGGVVVDISIDDFNALGFKFGDSVNVKFSNSYELIDIPYYSGYYVKTFEPLVVGYPGYEHIEVTFNNGDDLYYLASCDDNTTITISLNKEGKYLDVQNTLGVKYSDDFSNYNDEVKFANFRVMNYGTMRENIFYRSASPCDNQHNRAPYASRLCEVNNINYVFDLADNEEETLFYYNNNSDISYWKTLYLKNKILELDMAANVRLDNFKNKVKDMMISFLENDGPYLIHCTEGKDRTGFICLLIELLGHASKQELEEDYMMTYDNYFSINKESNLNSYNAYLNIKFEDFINVIKESNRAYNFEEENLFNGACNYLKLCGLNNNQIENILSKINK